MEEFNSEMGDVIIINTGPTDKILHVGLQVEVVFKRTYSRHGSVAFLHPRSWLVE
jgi:hypothetical protein